MWIKQGRIYVREMGQVELVVQPWSGLWMASIRLFGLSLRTVATDAGRLRDRNGKPREMIREAKHDAERMLREWIEDVEEVVRRVKDEVEWVEDAKEALCKL